MSADDVGPSRSPWGSWQVLEPGDGYKVKRIEVQPGHRLSYQTHSRRSEHWVVVAGIATCLLDGEVVVVRTGQHVVVGEGSRTGSATTTGSCW